MKRFQKGCVRWIGLAFGSLWGAPLPLGAQAHHGDLLIASSASGGGQLKVDFDFQQKVQTSYFATVGPTAVYTATEPGIDALDTDEPSENLYVLNSGTKVDIEVVLVDPPGAAAIVFPNGNSYRSAGATLDEPGDRVTLGVQGDSDPDGLHHHA